VPEFTRVSTRQGIRDIDAVEAEFWTGFKKSGIWIPYPGFYSTELIANDRPFGRLRLDRLSGGAKYLPPRGSGAQLYPAGHTVRFRTDDRRRRVQSIGPL
jgi:hypothetical protein